jgi:hypothetical protein
MNEFRGINGVEKVITSCPAGGISTSRSRVVALTGSIRL